MMDDLASEIKRLLPAPVVFSAYGLPLNRSGFVQCPFHQGDRHASLKVYSENKTGWHCFGCGAGGTVIDFVMRYFGVDFREACSRLNEDFHLGLTDRKPTRAGCLPGFRLGRRRRSGSGRRLRHTTGRWRSIAACWRPSRRWNRPETPRTAFTLCMPTR